MVTGDGPATGPTRGESAPRGPGSPGRQVGAPVPLHPRGTKAAAAARHCGPCGPRTRPAQDARCRPGAATVTPGPRRLGHRPRPTPGRSGFHGPESDLTAGPAATGRSKQTVGLLTCRELVVSALQGSRKARRRWSQSGDDRG